MITALLYYGFYVFFAVYYRLQWVFTTIWTHKTNIVAGILAFNLAGIIHELGHGLGNVLTGGTFGHACSTCTGSHLIVGGYGVNGVFMGVMPVFSIQVQEMGNRILMLLGGAWSIILLGWIAALWFNRRALGRRYGDFGNTLWKWGVGGVVYGFMTRAWFDSVYLLPVDPFPEHPSEGDGTVLYYKFKEMGWHRQDPISVFGVDVPVLINPEYIIGGIAILGTIYATYRLIKCTRPLCGCRP